MQSVVIFVEQLAGEKNQQFVERARRNAKDCRAMCEMCSLEKRNFVPNWSPSLDPKQISVEPSTKRRAKYISLLCPEHSRHFDCRGRFCKLERTARPKKNDKLLAASLAFCMQVD